jgi:hypothetical protein
MGGGESYGVTLTATDSGDGQVANNFVVVDVAATVPSSQIDSFYIPNVTIQAEVQAIRFLGGDEFLIPNAQEGVV